MSPSEGPTSPAQLPSPFAPFSQELFLCSQCGHAELTTGRIIADPTQTFQAALFADGGVVYSYKTMDPEHRNRWDRLGDTESVGYEDRNAQIFLRLWSSLSGLPICSWGGKGNGNGHQRINAKSIGII